MQFQLPDSYRKRYLERRVVDLSVLEKGRLEDFRRIGHQIRGSAKSFGFSDLETIALRLEQIDHGTLLELAPRILVDFKNCLSALGEQT